MATIPEEEKVKALERCLKESGHDVLSQHRYSKWRTSLPNRREVPNPMAFGKASDFVAFCKANQLPCLPAGKRTETTKRVFMSKSQLAGVLERFVDETGISSSARFEEWRTVQMAEGERLPSAYTISRRFDGWTKALPEAA